jgi:hypothetical protein
MKRKVIYLCYLPLVAKREYDFYMDALLSSGTAVEYWDLSKIFFPDVRFTMEVQRPYVRKINSYAELESMLSAQDLQHCFFIIIISFNGMVFRLHRMLTRHNCYLIFFARSGLPAFSAQAPLWKKIVLHYRQLLSVQRIKQKVLFEMATISRTFGFIKHYELVFAAGSVEAAHYGNSRIVAINHFDYDRYLTGRDSTERVNRGDYAVFLDDNLVFDSDFMITGARTIEPASYFEALRILFDRIEIEHRMQVVIAAHPKSEYRGNEFGDRPIIKDTTNELVRDCRFAMAHYSTSISFAVLHRKPIVFIYTPDMKKFDYFPAIKGLAQTLNAPLLQIGRSSGRKASVLSVAAPDQVRYNEYKYRYLTSPMSEQEESRTLFLRTMNGLLKR